MKTYVYKFADGTTSGVEVEDDLFEILTEMDKQEKYGNRRETRRHISIEELLENGIDIEDAEASVENILGEKYRTKKLYSIIDETLTERQKTVLLLYAFDKLSCREIGVKLHLGTQAVWEHLKAAQKKLKEFLE